VQAWFRSIDAGTAFDFPAVFAELQKTFDRTLYGGPTLYSLVEAGLKRGIPVQYLFEENEFQWGYGRKQIRGRSTTFHVDGIKDTEFTMFKDMVGDFLEMCGLPTPMGRNCYDEDEIVEEAVKIGYPVVVKPVAGHKGQGVVTGITDEAGVRKAYQNIIKMAAEAGTNFDGALVQRMIYGTDHRLLSVGGKFTAALQRVPAYVDGNGKDTIKDLIAIENDTIVRLDNARSPLCKIKIDDDLQDYLGLQKLTLTDVPADGERIYLRRVANISAGGVSINVTDNIHPLNIKLVEDIAKFFTVTCLGIDILTEDISKPWTEGNFGIIEINAGPGVFMHLAPALGGSVDVPGAIMKHHFPRPEYSRIPIIAGNKLSLNFANLLYAKLLEIDEDIEFGSLTEEGIYFNGAYFYKNPDHDQNVKIMLRNPKLDFAVFNHSKDDIFDFGTRHCGADIVILEDAHYAEDILKRDILPDGYYFEVLTDEVILYHNAEITNYPITEESDRDAVLIAAITPLLADLYVKY
jgi:cyanophycin synthetase